MTFIDDEDEDDGPPLGGKDLAVLAGIEKLPRMGEAINLRNLCRWTTLDADEVVRILAFLEEHGYVEQGRVQ